MRFKGLWITVLILAILITCGLITATFWGSLVRVSNATSFSMEEIFSGDIFLSENFKAETDETLTIDTGPEVITLIIENQFGDIVINGTDTEQISANIHKTAWGISEENAQEKLDSFNYEVIEEAQSITIKVKSSINPSGYQGQMDFKIEVPEKINIKIGNANGTLNVDKIKGSLDLSNSFGNVTIKNIQDGEILLSMENGEATLENLLIENFDLDVQNDFGNIYLRQVKASQANCFTQNGTIDLEDLNIKNGVEINGDFGEIYFDQGSLSDLTITSQNGFVNLTNLQIKNQIGVASDFGDITLEDVYAKQYDIESKNGVVSLDGANQSIINISSDFGAIDVNRAKDAQIDLRTNNGDITFIGNLIQENHTVESEFGSITIRLPGNQSINFDLRTEFGEIESEHEVLLSGDFSNNHWLGRLNEGGGLITIETKNGTISLEKSYAEEE